jgi:4-amino-4-deoxy-L-arabinose transferase-like glycosyltransferase
MDMRKTNHMTTVFICLILTVQFFISVRVLYLSGAPILTPDSYGYLSLARNLLGGGFFSIDGSNPAYFRTPGYPVFLAAILGVYDNLYLVCVIQVVLNICSAILLYKSVRIYTKNALLAIIAIFMFCLEFNVYVYAATILTEPLFVFLMTLTLYCFLLWRENPDRLLSFMGMSLSIMAGLLVKPAVMYLALLISLALVAAACFKKTTARHAMLYTALLVAVFWGWSFRNYLHSGHFIYTTIRNTQLFRWDARLLMSQAEGISSDEAGMLLDRALEARINGRNDLNEVDISFLEKNIGYDYIFAHFPEYLKMNLKGLATMMIGPGRSYMNILFTTPSMNRVVRYGSIAYLIVLWLLYAVGLLLHTRKPGFVNIILFLCIGYFAAAHALVGYSRYRLTLFPFLIAGIIFLWQKTFERILAAPNP